jgi:hypothetical protein
MWSQERYGNNRGEYKKIESGKGKYIKEIRAIGEGLHNKMSSIEAEFGII